jgi:hypothetical protein
MLELLGPAISITTATLLARSSLRIRRAENKFLKWGGAGPAAFFSAAVSVMSVMIVGLFKLHARGAPALDLKVAATPEQILRGQAISDGFCSVAIQEPARSRAASTSLRIFRCRLDRLCPPTSRPPGN